MKIIRKEEGFLVSLPEGSMMIFDPQKKMAVKRIVPSSTMGSFSSQPKPIRAWDVSASSGESGFPSCIVVYDVGDGKVIAVKYERSNERGWDWGRYYTYDPEVRSEIFLDPSDPKNIVPQNSCILEKKWNENVFGKWITKTMTKTEEKILDSDFVFVGEKGYVRFDQIIGIKQIYSEKGSEGKKIIFFLRGGIKSVCASPNSCRWVETVKIFF